MEKEQFYYDNKIVKMFFIATVVWGVVGMLVGLMVAFLFNFPNYMEGISWLSFGRLRFCWNVLFNATTTQNQNV